MSAYFKFGFATLLTLFLAASVLQDKPIPNSETQNQPEVVAARTIQEARSRAILLHETIAGSLQVVHRDLFNEEDSLAIPSASLQDVFDQLEKQHEVHLKWLTVETDTLNVDHDPSDPFEHQAVKALKSGKASWESVEDERYRFAGSILLSSQCLKCHVKLRKDNRDRTAGLVISMPLNQQQTGDE